MSKLNFTYRKLTVTIAIAAIALLQALHSTTSARSHASAVADLTIEKQALASFANDLTSLEKKVAELQMRTSITSTELNSAKTSASTLKTRTSQLGQTFQSVIRKLKAAGEWDNFDATVLARTTNPKVQSFISNAGGAKRILEDLGAQMSGLSLEIDSVVQPLNSRVASTGFSFGNSSRLGFMPARASFIPTVTVFKESLRCRFRSAVYMFNENSDNEGKMFCACLGAEAAADAGHTCSSTTQPR